MKTCFKCGEVKELNQFYEHKRMADGHLNKCKECTKKDTASRVNKLRNDPAWVVSEARRHREYSRLHRKSVNQELAKTAKAKWIENNKNKRSCHNIVNNAVRGGRLLRQPCRICGENKTEAHHEDYSKPLDVVWLCDKHHKERHVQIRDCIRLGMPVIPF